jgi:hypothetical protein
MTSASNALYGQDGLYSLLPELYRTRDAALGYPLRSFLGAVQQQVSLLAADIDQQYLNWFIETCDDRLVPYFAQLVGVDFSPVAQASESSFAAVTDTARQRRQVADAVGERRRKGSFSMLEQLTYDTTGWLARMVELTTTALTSRSARFPRAAQNPTADTGDGELMDVLGTPFSELAALTDVRRIGSRRTPGVNAPGAVVAWVWRLRADQVVRAPASVGPNGGTYRFDQFGHDIALCVDPVFRAAGQPPVEDLDVATPIRRGAFGRRIVDYYGPGRSICVFRGGHPIPREHVEVADLERFRHQLGRGKVAIDPERGRLAFDPRETPEETVEVSYSRLSIGAVGGGSYERPSAPVPDGAERYQVGRGAPHQRVGAAFRQWVRDREAGKVGAAAVIEIVDDGVYEETLELELEPGETLLVCAAPGCRPVLMATGRNPARHARVLIRSRGPRKAAHEDSASTSTGTDPVPGEPPHPSVTLDGLWIGGGPVELEGELDTVTLRHCTLPRTSIRSEERAEQRPSVLVRAMPCTISVQSSVLGRTEVRSSEQGHDPVGFSVIDSVLSGTDGHGNVLVGDNSRAYVVLDMCRTTVLGGAHVAQIDLVEDSIFTEPLVCEKRQRGTVRFSSLPLESRTPRRVGCQPDGIRATLEEAVRRGSLPRSDLARVLRREIARVEPRFDATEFGAPAFARLAAGTANEITRGATDEGELGAYHDLWESQLAADLESRLAEFAPVGTEISIRFAT